MNIAARLGGEPSDAGDDPGTLPATNTRRECEHRRFAARLASDD